MTEQDYGVRVLHAWSNMTVGRVIYPPMMLRQELVKRGLVEVVQPEADEKPVLRRKSYITK